MIQSITQPNILSSKYSSFYQQKAILSNVDDKNFSYRINKGYNEKEFDIIESIYKSKLYSNSDTELPFIIQEVNTTTKSDTEKKYSMIADLTQKVDRFNNWSDEDIPIGPSDEVLNSVKEILPELINKNLIPFRITPSIDEGLCLVFSKLNKIVYLEYYNDGDIGLISEDSLNKKILENIDLVDKEVVETLNSILG